MSFKPEIVFRRAGAGDFSRIAAIQAVSSEAAQWEPHDYLSYECIVAVEEQEILGFLAWRKVAMGESEILNLAVDPAFRRRGIASALLRELLEREPGTVYLEVRASNAAAREFYRKCGFRETGIRQKYYESPPEDGIVMTLQSC